MRQSKKRHKFCFCEILFFWKQLNINLLYDLIVLGIEIANIKVTEKTLNHILR